MAELRTSGVEAKIKEDLATKIKLEMEQQGAIEQTEESSHSAQGVQDYSQNRTSSDQAIQSQFAANTAVAVERSKMTADASLGGTSDTSINLSQSDETQGTQLSESTFDSSFVEVQQSLAATSISAGTSLSLEATPTEVSINMGAEMNPAPSGAATTPAPSPTSGASLVGAGEVNSYTESSDSHVLESTASSAPSAGSGVAAASAEPVLETKTEAVEPPSVPSSGSGEGVPAASQVSSGEASIPHVSTAQTSVSAEPAAAEPVVAQAGAEPAVEPLVAVAEQPSLEQVPGSEVQEISIGAEPIAQVAASEPVIEHISEPAFSEPMIEHMVEPVAQEISLGGEQVVQPAAGPIIEHALEPVAAEPVIEHAQAPIAADPAVALAAPVVEHIAEPAVVALAERIDALSEYIVEPALAEPVATAPVVDAVNEPIAEPALAEPVATAPVATAPVVDAVSEPIAEPALAEPVATAPVVDAVIEHIAPPVATAEPIVDSTSTTTTDTSSTKVHAVDAHASSVAQAKASAVVDHGKADDTSSNSTGKGDKLSLFGGDEDSQANHEAEANQMKDLIDHSTQAPDSHDIARHSGSDHGGFHVDENGHGGWSSDDHGRDGKDHDGGNWSDHGHHQGGDMFGHDDPSSLDHSDWGHHV